MTTFKDALKAANDLLEALKNNPTADHCDAIMHVSDLGLQAGLDFAEHEAAGLDNEADFQTYMTLSDKLHNEFMRIATC